MFALKGANEDQVVPKAALVVRAPKIRPSVKRNRAHRANKPIRNMRWDPTIVDGKPIGFKGHDELAFNIKKRILAERAALLEQLKANLQ